MNRVVKFLLMVWQLPQLILGKIILLVVKNRITKKEKIDDFSELYYVKNFPGGISLAPTIILNDKYLYTKLNTIKHEYGHTRQSLYLGPLYLLIIGLPSITWAGLYGKVIKYSINGYYKFYTEKWADKLGKVNRA